MGREVEFRNLPDRIIVDDELSLRRLEKKDAHKIFDIFTADPSIQRNVTWTANNNSTKDVERAIENFASSRSDRYAILYKQKLVGYIGAWSDGGYFTGIPNPKEYGFGYFIAPKNRGYGLALRATEAIIAAILRHTQVEMLAAYINDANTASQGVVKSLGFSPTDSVVDEPVLSCKERRWQKKVASL